MALSKFLCNCRDCGRLFQRLSVNTCPECSQAVQVELAKIADYARKRSGVTLGELSRALNISEKRLLCFVEDGSFRRLSSDVIYPCRICGSSIDNGAICPSCSARLNTMVAELRAKLHDSEHVFRPVEPLHGFAYYERLRAEEQLNAKEKSAVAPDQFLSFSPILFRREKDKGRRNSRGR